MKYRDKNLGVFLKDHGQSNSLYLSVSSPIKSWDIFCSIQMGCALSTNMVNNNGRQMREIIFEIQASLIHQNICRSKQH